jgi:hydrogenase large subunit
MAKKVVELQIPLNRVEGDLDIKVKIEDGVITDAKSVGTLYRGFENILKGRDPLDALVMTPRVCGICSISHLSAAVKALEDAYGITPPPQAIRLRNLSILCENLQSDIKQVFLMFMADFAHEHYKDYDFYETAKKYYEPFKGELSRDLLDATRNILKIIAYIGGQWPHTSHMVPGGLNILAEDLEILRIKHLIEKFKLWYEKEVLKCSFDEFLTITTLDQFDQFCKKYPQSHISIFYDIAKQTNLLEGGVTGYGFINYGAIDNEDNSTVVPRGYFDTKLHPLELDKITEDVTYSWYDADILNPMDGITKPNAKKENAYSFTKAPRYQGKVVQTGPLGEELALGNKLFLEFYKKYSDSTFVRELARMLRPIRFVKSMQKDIYDVIKNKKEPLYIKPKIKSNTQGIGLTHAARGALGHWIKIKSGKISNYQIISPTTWNGSPKDKDGNLGVWEKALIGVKIKDIDNPMEMGHIIRSFDPCLVCTVHFIGKDKKITLRA